MQETCSDTGERTTARCLPGTVQHQTSLKEALFRVPPAKLLVLDQPIISYLEQRLRLLYRHPCFVSYRHVKEGQLQTNMCSPPWTPLQLFSTNLLLSSAPALGDHVVFNGEHTGCKPLQPLFLICTPGFLLTPLLLLIPAPFLLPLGTAPFACDGTLS